jgi:cytochrome P450 family 110
MQPLPPGPSSPTLSLVRMMRDAYGLTARLAKQYGDPFTVRLPMQGPIVVTGDPAAIRGIFAADPETFASAGESMAPIIGRNSMVVLEGAAHRRARKLLTPPFHGSRMRAYGELMRERTRHRTSALSVGAPFEVQALAGSISLDVILQAIFGVREPAPMARLDQAVRGLMGAITPSIAAFAFLRRSFGGVGPWARFVRARGALMAIVSDELAARREDAAERDDILSLMLAARYDDGAAMSDEEIFDQLVTLVAAGHETSTITLAWACDWLHRNPAVLERLVAELDTLGAEPAPDALARLPFLEAVLNETLRLYPIVPVATRKLARSLELKGHMLPAGITVGAATSLVHYREDLYPEPERFDPERFLGRTFGASEYFPFGGGARRCLGAAFAMYEAKIVLGTLLGALRLRPVDDAPVLPAMGAAGVGPGRAVRMVLVERRQGG